MSEAESKTDEKYWTVAEQGYEGYYAFLANGKYASEHIVDTTTFVQGRSPESYDGYSANIGVAQTLCGRELVGRMVPLDHREKKWKATLCGSCLRALKTRRSTEPGGDYYEGKEAYHESPKCRYNGKVFTDVDGQPKPVTMAEPDMTEQEAQESDKHPCKMCVLDGKMGGIDYNGE